MTTTAATGQRMKNPAPVTLGAMAAIEKIVAATEQGGVDDGTLALVHLQASQIDGCSFRVDLDANRAIRVGEAGTRRLSAVAAWRDAP